MDTEAFSDALAEPDSGSYLAGIVARLRDVRTRSTGLHPASTRPPNLPSRKVLVEILEGLAAVLFPNRLGPTELSPESLDFFVGNRLDSTLRLLREQLGRELRFAAEGSGDPATDLDARAADIARAFAERLPDLRVLLDSDLLAAYQGDPAARSLDEVLVCYPGITAILHHRIAHALHRLGAPLVARMIAEIAHARTGIDIHPAARIGGSFFIDHGTGVVIGETAVIGQRVRLYQAVTLGAKRFPVDENGVLLKGNARHPIVEDDVVIYAGATILGRVTIGAGSVIGGNVWLTRSVPPNSNITQAKVRQDMFEEGAGI